jgi:hypothetical protein
MGTIAAHITDAGGLISSNPEKNVALLVALSTTYPFTRKESVIDGFIPFSLE